MRDFNEADRKKKRGRIQLPENPDQLSAAALTQLESTVTAAAPQGHVACPAAWKVAKDSGVSRLAVGAMIDRLSIRVTDCQLGCFAVEKTAHTGTAAVPPAEAPEIVASLAALQEKGELTCPNLFALAREHDAKPRAVAETANLRGYKLGNCQLGCF